MITEETMDLFNQEAVKIIFFQSCRELALDEAHSLRECLKLL
jgi:hypothetical protein